MIECRGYTDFTEALQAAREQDRTTVIYVRNDRLQGVPDYQSWWDVPVAEVSDMPAVNRARADWEAMRARQRHFL